MSDTPELRSYEITFIAEPNFDDERVNALVGKWTELIEKHGGEVQKVERMGKKRLAYTVEKRQYGYYLYSEVRLPGEAITPVKRWFALSEDIFRHMVVKMTDKDIKLKALTQDRYRKEMDRRSAATRPGGRDERPERDDRGRDRDRGDRGPRRRDRRED